jgi:hypothetical protein
MKPNTIGWFVIAFCVAVALLFSARAHSAPKRFNVASVAAAFASRNEPTIDPQELDAALFAVTQSREWTALLLTIGVHESGLRERIARSDCKPLECDGGRAWGLFQVHKTEANAEAWGSPDLLDQVREASRLARGAFYRCQHSGVPFPLSTLRAYAGRSCAMPLKGEADRLATFRKIASRL